MAPSTARRHSIYLKHERSSDLRFIVTLLRIVRVGLFFQTNFGARKLAVLGLSLCLVTGCGSNARDIVGAWRTSTDPNAMVWEFSSDGSVLMGTNRGRYSFGDNNRIKIETSIATSVYQMELVGDKMTLKEPNGSKLVLTRVK
jgi:hypothetical protein